MENIFKCDVCSKEFDNELELTRHEREHSVAELLSVYPGSMLCPDCRGSGVREGVTGYDMRTCYTCRGFGVVYKEQKIVYDYIPVKE